MSGFLLGAGLLALAGRRTDREAWRWRAALAIALAAWTVLWGPSFLTQARGGHSDWIPRTTLNHFVNTLGRLVTTAPHLYGVICIAVVAGAVLLVRSDRRLGRVFVCCAGVPLALAAASGAVAPVLLDRTLTVAAWGPVLAIAYLVGGMARRSRLLATVAVVAVVVVTVPAAIHVVTAGSTPDVALRHLDAVVQPGDVVAIRPRVKQPELAFSIGVRANRVTQTATVAGLSNTAGLAIVSAPGTPTATPLSGRIWLLDWNRRPIESGFVACAAPWTSGNVAGAVPAARRFRTRAPGRHRGLARVPDSFSFWRIQATTSSGSPSLCSAKNASTHLRIWESVKPSASSRPRISFSSIRSGSTSSMRSVRAVMPAASGDSGVRSSSLSATILRPYPHAVLGTINRTYCGLSCQRERVRVQALE